MKTSDGFACNALFRIAILIGSSIQLYVFIIGFLGHLVGMLNRPLYNVERESLCKTQKPSSEWHRRYIQ